MNASAAYWEKRPCNLGHSSQPVGSREYFDEVERKRYFVEPHILSFVDFPAWKGKSVLEIGCGIGTDATQFARFGAHYTGLDLSPKAIDLCQQRFGVYGLDGQFVVQNGERLERKQFPQVDLIYSWGVIHHTENPRAVVESAIPFLKPGGLFLAMVYAKNSWKNLMIEAGVDQPEAQADCPCYRVYTHQEARELFAPLKILSTSQDHIFPYEIPAYKRHEYVKAPWFQAMPPTIFDAMQKRMGWHLMVRAMKEQ